MSRCVQMVHLMKKKKKILNEFGNWMNINKEAIYQTRPWKIFGEGPIADKDVQLNAQGFNEWAYSKSSMQRKYVLHKQIKICMLQF